MINENIKPFLLLFLEDENFKEIDNSTFFKNVELLNNKSTELIDIPLFLKVEDMYLTIYVNYKDKDYLLQKIDNKELNSINIYLNIYLIRKLLKNYLERSIILLIDLIEKEK